MKTQERHTDGEWEGVPKCFGSEPDVKEKKHPTNPDLTSCGPCWGCRFIRSCGQTWAINETGRKWAEAHGWQPPFCTALSHASEPSIIEVAIPEIAALTKHMESLSGVYDKERLWPEEF